MKELEIPCEIEIEYIKLQKKWEKMGGGDTTFSMFDSIRDEGEKWIVAIPDFSKPIIDRDVIMVNPDFDEPKTSIAPIPATWDNLAKFFSMANDGHHIFIEYLVYDEKKNELEIITGS